jgi:hypothetical protein
MNMDTLDVLFQIFFARTRRRLGDGKIDAAWQLARAKMTGYLAFPVAAVTLVLVAIFYSFTSVGTHLEHKHWGEIIAAATGLVILQYLDRRFRKYLSAPPTLPPEETEADSRFVWRFRAISVAIFCGTCFIVYLLRKADVGFMQNL